MIATHVSSPIRSASSSGPIGWANPSFAIVSIASASATPSYSAQKASMMNGIRIRFETKPGKSFATRRLAELARQLGDRVGRLVGGLLAADDLDERHHRHGIEEVHADHAIGPAGRGGERRDRDRRRVRREHRLGGQHLVRAPEDGLLHCRVLDHGLDHQVGRDEIDRRARLARAPRRGRPALLGELPRLRRIARARARRRPAPRRRRDAEPEPRHDLGDSAPICPAPTTSTCPNDVGI